MTESLTELTDKQCIVEFLSDIALYSNPKGVEGCANMYAKVKTKDNVERIITMAYKSECLICNSSNLIAAIVVDSIHAATHIRYELYITSDIHDYVVNPKTKIFEPLNRYFIGFVDTDIRKQIVKALLDNTYFLKNDQYNSGWETFTLDVRIEHKTPWLNKPAIYVGS